MFDEQHDCQAFVGSNILLSKSARMRVVSLATTGILFALSLLVLKTGLLLSGLRHASERQELAHQSSRAFGFLFSN